MIEYETARITKLREYLLNVIYELLNSDDYQINADMLSEDAENYSLDKIPTVSEYERWITGVEIHRDVFAFRSRKAYSQDVINNLTNIGFFEKFEDKIKNNNDKGVLPDIEGIESIKCLNCGAMNNAGTNTATFNVQIEIKYKKGVTL